MFRPVAKRHSTRLMIAPQGWDEKTHGKCHDLPITDQDGVMYSYWRPPFWDRVKILLGQPIRLCIVGTNHPPVGLDTDE